MKMATTTVERLLAGVVSLIMAATILEEFTGHIRGVSQASVINSKPRPIRIPVNPAGPQSLHDIQYAHHISARVHHRRGSSPRAEKALSLVPNEDKLFIENIPIDSYSAKGPKRLLSRPPSTNFLRPGLKDLSLKASSEYPNFFRNSSAPDRGKFGRLYSKGISQRKSERQQLLLTGGKHQRDRVYVRPMRRKRRRRSKRMAGFDQEDTRIPPEYGLVVHVQNVESGSNSSIDSTISRLKSALATELSWVPQFIHVKSINFAGSRIEFYFENADGQLVTANRFLSEDLQDRLSGHVPDLGLSQVSPDREITSRHHEPIWTKTYFPYAVAGVSVGLVILIVFAIYFCFCWNSKEKKEVDEEAVVGHSIYYPALKPELAEPTPVQPDSPVPTFSAAGLSTPVPAQPIRIKAKGLLERRGSNASLTLDLNPTSDLGRWEGTPPKESTALEFLMSAGNRLSRRDLRNAVKHTKILYEEFWEIPMNHTEKVSVAGSGMKNRYKTIIPNEHSRVVLPDIDNDPLNSYINANYIRGYEGEPRAYIATQGPMAHTVMDFWRMIWFEKCPIIVMITKLKEKSKPKCENYLPERWGVFGDVEVVIDKSLCKKGYILRHITLRCNGESHSVLHYWYTAWPDHKPPDSPHMLLDLIKEVELRRYQTFDLLPRGPVCVHCSAGIGRTGCFIAISIGIRQLREEHSVDALGIVCSMRIDRGGMIQTHEQYDFVHQALAAYERELGEPSVQSITALTTESVTTP